MTINLDYFVSLRNKIMSAGREELAEIKKQMSEHVAMGNGIAVNGEDPTGGWYLYLDALCDLRLGAFAWDGGQIMHFWDGELDLLADWYEALCEVARSINRRQKDGRGGCNESKFSALADFVGAKAVEIEHFTGPGLEYARYLYERTNQVFNMKKTGCWGNVDKIEVFRGKCRGIWTV